MKYFCFFILFFCICRVALCQDKLDSVYNSSILPGEFSISETETVRFSKGNLHFNTISKIWKFAEKQYHDLGELKIELTSSPVVDLDGWISAFQWGTNGILDLYPNTSEKRFIPAVSDGCPLYDWGSCPIINGGGFNNMWRTLTAEEWRYLLVKRHDAKIKFSTATVCGIKGLVILPDTWNLPTGCEFNYERINDVKESGDTWEFESSNYTNNVYNEELWRRMERNGAVFLPASEDWSGFKSGSYWSSTSTRPLGDEIYSDSAYHISFDSKSLESYPFPPYKINWMSVRLVQSNKNCIYRSSVANPSIINIIEYNDTIKVEFEMCIVFDYITIDPHTYLQTNTGERAKLKSTSGIMIEPNKTYFRNEDGLALYHFTLNFEKLSMPLNKYNSFSIYENPNSSWKWEDIKLIE